MSKFKKKVVTRQGGSRTLKQKPRARVRKKTARKVKENDNE